MALNKLTARRVATAQPGKHEDGGGLRLVVNSTGSRTWVLRVTVAGKRREMGLGSYPAIGLQEARTAAEAARKLVKQGLDPIAARRAEPARATTFTSAAAQYIRAHRHGWRNAKHARQWAATLKTYARPFIGAKAVSDIGTDDVLALLKPIWTTKTETAKRVQGRIENVLDYAAARKWRDPVNPARWRGHLDKLLPRPTRVVQPVHHPAMPYRDVPGFLSELADNASVSASALRFLILTACRTAEVLGAQWSELDLEGAMWTIPAKRTKAHREHRVPLSHQGMAVLASLPRLVANTCVFPGAQSGKPLSNMSLLQLMRGMGHGVGGQLSAAVPHGFRSTFRDWASEQTATPHAVMEAALAHVISDATVAAYARSDLFEKRRLLMDQWGAYCLSAPAANVLSFSTTR